MILTKELQQGQDPRKVDINDFKLNDEEMEMVSGGIVHPGPLQPLPTLPLPTGDNDSDLKKSSDISWGVFTNPTK